ncbi:DUF6455 family protein [uncultured Shimia sp.]|uniref:DUF6455 family protein n=1 Tax=uncultured Shimia sp. TaxID=573152 RepID=UPI00262EE56F|nr:DUF6455 family protein [uncultured Shimia sp.]
MKPLGDQNAHFWLVQRMAQLTETDLVAAMDAAKLTQEDWAAMVQECRGCDWTSECRKFLALREGVPVEEAPDTCRNQERFSALRAALEEIET